jgi:small-conductance mechanosensitive channel
VAEEAEPSAEPISLSKIGEEADRTKTRLEGIKTRIERGPSLGHVESELPKIAARVAELEGEESSKNLAALSEREIEDLTFAWQEVARQIKALQGQLGDESDRFENELQRAQTMLGRWSATAKSSEITPAAKVQADGIDRAIRKVEAEIRGHLDTIHDAQTRVSGNGQIVTQRLADFAGAREAHRARTLTRGEPLWRVDPRAGESPVRLALRTVRRQADQVRIFLDEGVGSLMGLAVAWLLSWWVLVALARLPIPESKEISKEINEGMRSSLRRPWAAALVLVIGGFALFGPPVPWALRQALWLLSLPALLRLLAPTPYRSIALVFVGPLMLSLSSEIVPASSEWARYMHLLVSATGLVAALWVGRWRGNVALRGLGLRGMRVAEALLGGSILANVAGYGALAPVVNYATMFGIFLAVLILASVGVYRALLTMSVRTDILRRSNAIAHRGDRISMLAQRYLVIAAWLVWIVAAADGFGIAEPVSRSVKLWMEETWEIGAFSVAPGDLLAFGLTLYAALLTSRLLGLVLDEDVLPRLNLARGLPPTVSMLVRYFVLAVGFLVATVAAGVQLDKLSLLVGAFGVGIGFGLQNVVNNFVSGLILMFERPVKVGDTVEAGTWLGEVTQIGLRASTIRTLQGAEVIVPNSNLISDAVINWTLSDHRRRFEVDVGVAYGTDPEKVIEILKDVANSNRRVLGYPEPMAWFLGFGDSSLNFQVLSWTGDFQDWRGVRSEVTVAVNRALADAGITIPFPQRDLHVRSIDDGLIERARGETPAAPSGSPDDAP